MAPNRIVRPLAAAATIATGLAAALLIGAPLSAALAALLAGAVAFSLIGVSSNGDVGREVALETGDPLPGAADVLEAVDEPLLIVRDRRIILANQAARQVLGEHIEGVDFRLAIRHPAAAERLAESGPAADAATKTELVGLGERDRRWEMAVSRLKDGSRLVRLADRSEAFASEQMRGDFVANASHELRTPLATLLGFLETLQDDHAAADKKTRSRFLGIMLEEARRMHGLVDDLISLSRIEAERFTLPRESVDLLPLVEEVRRSCEQMIEEKRSGIVVENGEVLPFVLGDKVQLLQMLQNLIVNALKYGRGGTPVIVRFEASGAEMLRLSVIDQGEGIAPEHLPRLTERFYRVDPSRSRAVGGTGLGLAIVKHIVGRHRGRLDIRSEVGEGTTVRVYLPRASEAPVTKE
jgi:two-component system phosphate regulon sensor histidine kinase PhoR